MEAKLSKHALEEKQCNIKWKLMYHFLTFDKFPFRHQVHLPYLNVIQHTKKVPLWNLQTTNAQISLRIRAG